MNEKLEAEIYSPFRTTKTTSIAERRVLECSSAIEWHLSRVVSVSHKKASDNAENFQPILEPTLIYYTGDICAYKIV